jgi:hypothetical protein
VYFAIFSLPTACFRKRAAWAHFINLPLRPCTSCALESDEKRDAFGPHEPCLGLRPDSQKRRVALFMEYFAFFLLVVWKYVTSCVSMHFRRENCMPATSGSDAVRNWMIQCTATVRLRTVSKRIRRVDSPCRVLTLLLARLSRKPTSASYLPGRVPP